MVLKSVPSWLQGIIALRDKFAETFKPGLITWVRGVCVDMFTILVGTRSPHKYSKQSKTGDILPVPTRTKIIFLEGLELVLRLGKI